MKRAGLRLAPEKAVAVMLSGRKRYNNTEFHLEDVTITPVKDVKYLGVIVDKDLSFTKHLVTIADKADKSAAAIGRIMTRFGGTKEARRRLLTSVVESMMLYATPVWSKVLQFQKYKEKAARTQRKVALKITRGYRTMSTETVRVLARVILFELLAEERILAIGKTVAEKKRLRENIVQKWHDRWRESEAKWIKRVIPDIRAWYYRTHGEINYHLAQVLSGHGCFQKYLYRIVHDVYIAAKMMIPRTLCLYV